MGGDFNVIRRSLEKLGGSSFTSSMRDFDGFIRDCECEEREKNGESLIIVIEKIVNNTHWTWVYIYMLVRPTIQ